MEEVEELPAEVPGQVSDFFGSIYEGYGAYVDVILTYSALVDSTACVRLVDPKFQRHCYSKVRDRL